MRNKQVFIYTLSDPRDGQIRYVGKSVDPNQRMFTHLKEKTWTKKNHWIIGLQKSGLKPAMEVLEETNESNWQEAERFWIVMLRFYGFNLLNIESGGTGPTRVSEETKIKIGNANRGKKRTDEMRKTMREAWMKSEASRNHISKLSESNRGRSHKVETKEKIRSAHAGRSKTQEQRNNMRRAMLGNNRIAQIRASMTNDQLAAMSLKMKEAWRNRRLTPASQETRMKMRLAHKKKT